MTESVDHLSSAGRSATRLRIDAGAIAVLGLFLLAAAVLLNHDGWTRVALFVATLDCLFVAGAIWVAARRTGVHRGRLLRRVVIVSFAAVAIAVAAAIASFVA